MGDLDRVVAVDASVNRRELESSVKSIRYHLAQIEIDLAEDPISYQRICGSLLSVSQAAMQATRPAAEINGRTEAVEAAAYAQRESESSPRPRRVAVQGELI